MSARLTPPRPLLPTTIRPTRSSSASLTISASGFPTAVGVLDVAAVGLFRRRSSRIARVAFGLIADGALYLPGVDVGTYGLGRRITNTTWSPEPVAAEISTAASVATWA